MIMSTYDDENTFKTIYFSSALMLNLRPSRTNTQREECECLTDPVCAQESCVSLGSSELKRRERDKQDTGEDSE